MIRALLFLSPLAFGGLALLLGQDGSWDLRNYHFYNPWAFLHGRMDLDVAPAHNATFYNPLLHLPFYHAVTQLPPRAVAFLLGTVQGTNLWLVYAIARRVLPSSSRGIALLLAAVGALGAGNLAELGTSFGDNVVSLFVLAALLLLLGEAAGGDAARGASGPASSQAPRSLHLVAAGLLAGMAAGLKLPASVFAVGLCAGLLALPGSGTCRLQRMLVFGFGTLAGVALADGFWLAEMWRRFGNPLFPYFNDVFLSPWGAPATYRDPRFLPVGWLEWLAFPLVVLFDPRQAGEVAFLDLRLPLLYLGLAALLPAALRDVPGTRTDAAGRYLLAAGVVAYLLWLKLFAIQRYALVLEMLAPLGVWLVLQRCIRDGRRRRYVGAAALALMSLATIPANWDRVPFGDDYFGVTPPVLPDPGRSLVLMADHDATAYLIPRFPAAVRFLRIDGYFTGPTTVPHDYDRLIARAIREHRGDLYLLARSWEREGAGRALAFHRLAADWSACEKLKPHIDPAGDGELLFCPARPTGAR